MDFNTYWTLIGGDTNFADRKAATEKAWSLCSPEKQQAIIAWLQTHDAKFGTTTEQGGWKMENPTGNQVIYVKQN